jgi:hypothetical protein
VLDRAVDGTDVEECDEKWQGHHASKNSVHIFAFFRMFSVPSTGV